MKKERGREEVENEGECNFYFLIKIYQISFYRTVMLSEWQEVSDRFTTGLSKLFIFFPVK